LSRLDRMTQSSTPKLALEDFRVRGRCVPHDLTGHLTESSIDEDATVLHKRLVDDGYLLIRSALDDSEVQAARCEVFSHLVEMGEIRDPAVDGIATGESRRRELVDDLVENWKTVSEGPAVRQLTHGRHTRSVMDRVFGEPSRPHDYLWLRPRKVGWSTGLHYDHPFFFRNSNRVFTAWIPLGDIPLSDGPLMIVEGSNRFTDLLEPMYEKDQQIAESAEFALKVAFQGEWDMDAIEFAQQRQARLLSAAFFSSDLLVFRMDALHGSLDNHSSINRVRLSCDIRFQPASFETDGQYFGPNPTGQAGNGYASMNSCNPLTE
jgi:hypothetical protein